jgi:pentatricopeptide repeat protein
LEPDIIGELFLLDFLNPENIKEKKKLKAFVETSWEHSPIQMFNILNLMSQDFISHPAFPDFIIPAESSSTSRFFWGSLCVNLINAYGNANELEKARNLFEELTALATGHPEEAELRLEQAKAAFNLIIGYAKANELEKARNLFEELTALATGHPEEAELRLPQAKAAVNLIIDYAKANELEKARNLFEELTALATGHPEEAELRLEQAKAAFNLINDYGNANELEKARVIALKGYDALFSKVFNNFCVKQFGKDQTKIFLDYIKDFIGDRLK